jgi:hypothetical protein
MIFLSSGDTDVADNCVAVRCLLAAAATLPRALLFCAELRCVLLRERSSTIRHSVPDLSLAGLRQQLRQPHCLLLYERKLSRTSLVPCLTL